MERRTNPALGTHLRGSPRTIPHDLFTPKELDQLYESYKVLDARTLWNKVILGMLVYQGLTPEELEKLQPKHIHLSERKLVVPPSEKRNGRQLEIQENQIHEMKAHMERILPEQSKRLFQGRKENGGLKNNLLPLHHGLRRINPEVKNAAQIRQSVISEWLKETDLRTVQYWEGHRYVSSTERYQTGNLEELREACSNIIPSGNDWTTLEVTICDLRKVK
jgi:integrase/recombinase XerD